jgi:hypothetical protein
VTHLHRSQGNGFKNSAEFLGMAAVTLQQEKNQYHQLDLTLFKNSRRIRPARTTQFHAEDNTLPGKLMACLGEESVTKLELAEPGTPATMFVSEIRPQPTALEVPKGVSHEATHHC